MMGSRLESNRLDDRWLSLAHSSLYTFRQFPTVFNQITIYDQYTLFEPSLYIHSIELDNTKEVESI